MWRGMDTLRIRYLTNYRHCNYACEYCIAGHASRAPRPAWDSGLYRRVLDNIARLPRRVSVRIGVGGEFFLDPELVAGARALSRAENLEALNLITNLSLPWTQYERMLEGFRLEKVAIVASFHPTQVPDRHAWLETARRFSEQTDLAAILVAYPPLLSTLDADVRWLRENGIETFVQPFIGTYRWRTYPAAYSRRQRSVIEPLMYSRHDLEHMLNLKRPGLCTAGCSAVYVDASGLVYPCGGGPYSDNIGALSAEPHLELRDTPRPCPFQTCQCDTENINTVQFQQHYRFTGLNQHKYIYRFADEAQQDSRLSEWRISY